MFRKTLPLILLLTTSAFIAGYTQPSVELYKKKIDSLYTLEQTPARDSTIGLRLLGLISTELPFTDSSVKAKSELYQSFVDKSTFLQSQAHYYYLMGNLYNRLGYYNLAGENLNKAVKLFEGFGNDLMYFYSYNEFARIISLIVLNNPEKETEARSKFFEFTHKQMEKAKQLKDSLLISTYYLNIALKHLAEKNYQEGRVFYRKSWQAVAHDPQRYWYAYYGGRWAEGLCLIHMNQTKAGFKLINEAISASSFDSRSDLLTMEKANLRYVIGYLLGDYYIKKEQYDLALKETLIGKEMYAMMQSPILNHFLNKNFYRIYKAKGRYKEALNYYEQVADFNNKLENVETKERYMIWANEQENIKKDNRIKALEVENLTQITQRQSMLRNILILGLVFAGLLTLYILRSNRQLKDVNSSLTQKNKEIETALFKGQHLERKRVASELHDTLATKVSALKWRLEAIEENFVDENRVIIQNTIQSLEELYTDVRFISHNLLPEELERRGLKTALATLLEKLNRLNKTEFHLVFDGIDNSLEQTVQYEFYNIVLELCNNIMKHAQATNAYISISEINERLFLTVTDDGVGIKSQKKAKGIGQSNIRNRIESLGGDLEISSNSEGTKIVVRV